MIGSLSVIVIGYAFRNRKVVDEAEEEFKAPQNPTSKRFFLCVTFLKSEIKICVIYYY